MAERHLVPKTQAGKLALIFTAVSFASWVILPLITINFRDTFPITDTWLMPAIATMLVSFAAIYNVLCIWRWHERALLTIISAALAIPAAMFALLMVIGEGLSGV